MRCCSETGHSQAPLCTRSCTVFSYKLVYAKEAFGLCPDLVVCPAGLPHAQGLGVGELSFEAEQDPAVAEEQLEAVLAQPGQVLVEAGQHETQQLPQVHLEAEREHTVLQTQSNIFEGDFSFPRLG